MIITSDYDLLQNVSILKVGCKKLILLLWQKYAARPDETRVCYIGGSSRAKFLSFPALDLHFSFPQKLPLAEIYIFAFIQKPQWRESSSLKSWKKLFEFSLSLKKSWWVFQSLFGLQQQWKCPAVQLLISVQRPMARNASAIWYVFIFVFVFYFCLYLYLHLLLYLSSVT